MKVLVTGATGFIGNYVVMELLKNKHTIIATSGDEEKAKRFGWFHEVKYMPLNLLLADNSINYFNYFDNPDIVIHLAWEGLPNYNSSSHIEKNLPQHSLFLKNLILNGAKNITVSGTCLEYGMQEGKLNEELIPLPANPYAIAKDSLRKFLEQLQQDYSFDLKWARLFYIYGEGQNKKSILSQLATALRNGDSIFNMSGGEQQRDYLPAETVAEYLVKIALQNKINGIINCCSGIPVTINKLIENYLAEKKQNIRLKKGFYPYNNYEPMNFWGDDNKLKRILLY